MDITAEQIEQNWKLFLNNIKEYISKPRQIQLLNFYDKYADRIMMMPAAHKKEYHSAYPGGYVVHVNNVVRNSLKLYDVWKEMGADMSTFTLEELIFSAINHDLGKMGDEKNESYIPQTDQWRKDKLGEDYMFNSVLAFAAVPDRSLFLLQRYGIKYTFNEMIAIQTHDGLYDESNKKYLMGYSPEQKPRTCLPYILHQADLMAARIEFEQEWGGKFDKKSLDKENKGGIVKKTPGDNKQNKALKSVKSKGLASLLDNIS